MQLVGPQLNLNWVLYNPVLLGAAQVALEPVLADPSRVKYLPSHRNGRSARRVPAP